MTCLNLISELDPMTEVESFIEGDSVIEDTLPNSPGISPA